MHHATDVMANLGLWEERMSRLDRARKTRGIDDLRWTAMKTAAGRGDVPFLQALGRAVRSAPGR